METYETNHFVSNIFGINPDLFLSRSLVFEILKCLYHYLFEHVYLLLSIFKQNDIKLRFIEKIMIIHKRNKYQDLFQIIHKLLNSIDAR